MCAITGSINLNIERDRINSILKKLNHRGPDDHNYYLNQDINTSVFFAHNRLEILDISHGKQPMISDDGRYRGFVFGDPMPQIQLNDSSVLIKKHKAEEFEREDANPINWAMCFARAMPLDVRRPGFRPLSAPRN